MQDPSDKSDKSPGTVHYKKNDNNPRKLARSRRRAAHAKKPDPAPNLAKKDSLEASSPLTRVQGYDPEFLYVECGRCGSPVLWEDGKASKLLMEAGVDPLELDSSCLLLTDGCPACGSSREYSVRIFRLSDNGATHIVPLHGHA